MKELVFIRPTASLRFGGRWVEAEKESEFYKTIINGLTLYFSSYEVMDFDAYCSWFRKAEYMKHINDDLIVPVSFEVDLRDYYPITYCGRCGKETTGLFSYLCEQCQYPLKGEDA